MVLCIFTKVKGVLVLGLGISGLSTVKALNQLGAKIVVSDSKRKKNSRTFSKTQDIEFWKNI